MFRNIYVCIYAYMYTTTINEKEIMNWNERKEGYLGRFEGMKKKGEMM